MPDEAQRIKSMLKRAASSAEDYLLVTNQEVFKNLPPASKEILLKNLEYYNTVSKENERLRHYYASQRIPFTPPNNPQVYLAAMQSLLARKSSPEVLNVKREIYNQLNLNIPTPLNQFLKNLPENKKISLVAALLAGDGAKIEKILFSGTPPECPLIADKAVLMETFRGISHKEPFEMNSPLLLSSIAAHLIQAIMAPRDGQLAPLPAQQALFIESVMKTIPDLDMTPKLKTEITASLLSPSLVHLIDPFYFESAKPDDPHRAKALGKITPQEYKAALKDPKMDKSEFIMLSLGLLKERCGEITELPAIRRAYLERDYESAIAQILTVSQNHKTVLGESLVNVIAAKSITLTEVDPARNYNRRYFENAIAKEHLVKNVNLERINKVCQRISGVSFDISDPKKAVDIMRDAVSSVNDFHKYDPVEIRKRQYEIGNAVETWKLRKKTKKPGFVPKIQEGLGGVEGQVAYSRNIGVMVANQPAPRDDIAEEDHINRTPDKAFGHGQYSPRAARSAMAGDVSGHALFLVARLEAYMKEFSENPPLQEDVNEFVKGFVSTYMMRGSHSLDEIYDLLRDPVVEKIFTDQGITLDLSWSDSLLKEAADACQDYSKNMALQKVAQAEILAGGHRLKATPPPPVKVEVPWTPEEREMLANIQKEESERHEFYVPQSKAYSDLNGFSQYLRLNGHVQHLEADGKVKGINLSAPYTNPRDSTTPYVTIQMNPDVHALFQLYSNPPQRAAAVDAIPVVEQPKPRVIPDEPKPRITTSIPDEQPKPRIVTPPIPEQPKSGGIIDVVEKLSNGVNTQPASDMREQLRKIKEGGVAEEEDVQPTPEQGLNR